MTGPRQETMRRDSKTNLYEAARAAIKDQEAKQDAERFGRLSSAHRRRRLGFLGVVGIAAAVLLVVQPVWLAGPKAVPPEPPRLAAASMRLTLVRERHRVFDYARRAGRLPATLAEAGGGSPDITYQASSGDAFSLTGTSGDSVITLRSSDSLTAFLGSSLIAVRDRGRP
ncbi:MAG: hypothetical protein ACRENB_03345 [Gemmatimonadales bacterium]